MPNHVYNTISVSGKPEDVKQFFAIAKSTHTITYTDWSIPSTEKVLVSEEESRDFSFRAFIKPPEEEYSDYFTPAGGLVQNWYHWNVDNWGTKWDAYEVEITDDFVSFTTAWNPPMPVFEAIIKQFPELDFEFRYEEEQGWGGEITVSKGVTLHEKNWDIPNSHADNEDLGRECNCDSEDDSEYWYADCPKMVELKQEMQDA